MASSSASATRHRRPQQRFQQSREGASCASFAHPKARSETDTGPRQNAFGGRGQWGPAASPGGRSAASTTAYDGPKTRYRTRNRSTHAFANEHAHKSSEDMPPSVLAGFFFKKRSERLDWRMLASISLERIQREVDIQALQEIIENITFCDVDAEDVRYVDPNFLKLFKMAQLIIEYLLHSQDYLAEHRAALLRDVEDQDQKLDLLTDTCEKQVVDCNALKKENRTLKKTLYAYQLMAKIPGVGSDPQVPVSTSYHRCLYCPKVFRAQFYLDNHTKKRHPDSYRRPLSPSPPDSPRLKPKSFNHSDQSTSVTDLLAQQIRQIIQVAPTKDHHSNHTALVRDMLQTTLEQMDQKSKPNISGSDAVADMLRALNDRIEHAEKSLRDEMEEKMKNTILSRESELKAKYEEERLKHQLEMQQLTAAVHKQLDEERSIFNEEKEALSAMVAKKVDKMSRLGNLEDDDGKPSVPLSPEQDLIQKMEKVQAEALKEMKAKLDADVASVQGKLLSVAEKEKKDLEERLNHAASQISILQQALYNEHNMNVNRDEELRNALVGLKEKTVQRENGPTHQPQPMIKLNSKDLESDSVVKKDMSAVEDDDDGVPLAMKKKSIVIDDDDAPLVARSSKHQSITNDHAASKESQAHDDDDDVPLASRSIKHQNGTSSAVKVIEAPKFDAPNANISTQREPDNFAKKTTLDWEACLKLLNTHTNSHPTNGSIRSLSQQSESMLLDARKAAQESLEHELKLRDIVGDKISPEKLKQVTIALTGATRVKDLNNAVLAKLRPMLDEQISKIAAAQFTPVIPDNPLESLSLSRNDNSRKPKDNQDQRASSLQRLTPGTPFRYSQIDSASLPPSSPSSSTNGRRSQSVPARRPPIPPSINTTKSTAATSAVATDGKRSPQANFQKFISKSQSNWMKGAPPPTASQRRAESPVSERSEVSHSASSAGGRDSRNRERSSRSSRNTRGSATSAREYDRPLPPPPHRAPAPFPIPTSFYAQQQQDLQQQQIQLQQLQQNYQPAAPSSPIKIAADSFKTGLQNLMGMVGLNKPKYSGSGATQDLNTQQQMQGMWSTYGGGGSGGSNSLPRKIRAKSDRSQKNLLQNSYSASEEDSEVRDKSSNQTSEYSGTESQGTPDHHSRSESDTDSDPLPAKPPQPASRSILAEPPKHSAITTGKAPSAELPRALEDAVFRKLAGGQSFSTGDANRSTRTILEESDEDLSEVAEEDDEEEDVSNPFLTPQVANPYLTPKAAVAGLGRTTATPPRRSNSMSSSKRGDERARSSSSSSSSLDDVTTVSELTSVRKTDFELSNFSDVSDLDEESEKEERRQPSKPAELSGTARTTNHISRTGGSSRNDRDTETGITDLLENFSESTSSESLDLKKRGSKGSIMRKDPPNKNAVRPPTRQADLDDFDLSDVSIENL